MTDPPTRASGRPRDLQKGRAILDAAWELFLQRGVEATPIEAIAAKARVSKVTLYSHYPDKLALFRAAVGREMTRIEAAQRTGAPDGGASAGEPVPIADALRAFGMGLMAFLTSAPAIDFYSVVAGELRRHADLASAFYELGPGMTRRNLAALIATATARGELSVADPAQAAEDLFGLWQGFTNFQFALGIEVDAVRAALSTRVDHGVACFMAVYRR